MTDDIAELAGGLRTVVSRLAHSLRKPPANEDITPTRLTALVTLQRLGPLRPGDLATRLSISAASMSRVTEVLADGKWINRTPDPADGRACLLELSEHGRAVIDAMRRESVGDLAAGIGELTAEQRAALQAALPVLVILADKGQR